MHDRGRAYAGVVDKGGAACAYDGYAGESAEARTQVERLGEYALEHGRHALDVGDDDEEHHQEVEPYHERHHHGGYTRYALDTAENHHSYYHRYRRAEEQTVGADIVEAEIAADSAKETARGHAVGGGERCHKCLGELVGVHYAESAEEAGDGEELGKGRPSASHAAGDDVHGAALRIALVVAAFIHYCQHALMVFGGHAHERTHPHPEYRSGAAHNKGDGHAGDVAQPDGGGHYRRQGLHRRYLPVVGFAVLLGAQLAQRRRQTAQRHRSRAYEKI